LSDPTHTVPSRLSITVWPENKSPAIEHIAPSRAVLAPPVSEVELSARTSDPDGDAVSHWWRVKSAPAGARPVFSKQGGRDTKVSGLRTEGAYVFELTAVDRSKATSKQVSVTVSGRP